MRKELVTIMPSIEKAFISTGDDIELSTENDLLEIKYENMMTDG